MTWRIFKQIYQKHAQQFLSAKKVFRNLWLKDSTNSVKSCFSALVSKFELRIRDMRQQLYFRCCIHHFLVWFGNILSLPSFHPNCSSLSNRVSLCLHQGLQRWIWNRSLWKYIYFMYKMSLKWTIYFPKNQYRYDQIFAAWKWRL